MATDPRYTLAVCTNDNCQFRFCVKCKNEVALLVLLSSVVFLVIHSGSAELYRLMVTCRAEMLRRIVRWAHMP